MCVCAVELVVMQREDVCRLFELLYKALLLV